MKQGVGNLTRFPGHHPDKYGLMSFHTSSGYYVLRRPTLLLHYFIGLSIIESFIISIQRYKIYFI